VSRGNYKVRYPHLTVEDLMVLVGGGDADAFAALYERHCRSAYTLARRVTGNAQDAEDLVQGVFLKLWRSVGSYRAQRVSVRTWMLAVVRNQGIDRLRSQASHRRTQEKAEAPMGQPSEAFAETWRKYRRARVQEALLVLPHAQYKILDLPHFSDRTNADVAARFCLPLGTVEGRMRLGLKKLRNHPELREIASG
jgi:RNA polymerase sigma-70 factor, ECF subfamily